MGKDNRRQRNKVLYMDMLVRGVPRSVNNAFAAWCRLRNVTQREKIISLMRETVQQIVLEEERKR